MIWRSDLHKKLVQLGDYVSVLGSFFLAFHIWENFRLRTNIPLPIVVNEVVLVAVFLISFAWIILFSAHQAYSFLRFTSLLKEFLIVLKTSIYGTIIFVIINFAFRIVHLPRTFVMIFFGVNVAMLIIEKTTLFIIVRIRRNSGMGRKNILVVGSGKEIEKFLFTVKKNFDWGLDITGVITESRSIIPSEMKILGSDYKDFESLLHSYVVDEVIICSSNENLNEVFKILECCNREGVQVRLYSNSFDKIAKKIRVDSIFGLQIMSFVNVPDNETLLFIKRIMDILISALLLLILSPLMLILALLVKISSPGPALYEWNVVGLNKKPFKSWKYRTMIENADDMKEHLGDRNEMNGPVFKIKNDPRITKLGRYLRKFSLDELPQLISVFKGDMSLVGPRPAGPHELVRYESWQRKKLCIKPGMTCLWQVNGRNNVNDFNEWVKMDLEYINNWSIGLDIKILMRTISAVFKGTGC